MKKHSLKNLLSTSILFLSLAGGMIPGALTAPTASLFPATKAAAAEAPAFVTKRSSLYENGSGDGTYLYTIKNLKKGYTVKWSKSGAGASYVSFKKKSTPVTGRRISNQVTVDTLGSMTAKNKKVTLTAKVYDKNNKLVKKLSDSVTLKVSSTSLRIKTTKITDSLTSLSTGKSYDFDAAISPSNATSQLYWSVTDQSGSDCSWQITSEGIWTPTTNGSFTICAYTKNGASSQILSTAKITATVGSTFLSARQTARDTIAVSFSGNMKSELVLSDFSLSYLGIADSTSSLSSTGSLVSLKELSLSEDGKTAYIKAYNSLTNKGVYQLSYKGSPVSTITASSGQPVSGVILTTQVPANTYKNIDFILYDQNGVDVTSAYKHMVSFDGVVPNGYLTSSGSLQMNTLGEYASVIMTCHTSEETFTVNANIMCVAEGSSGIRTMITSTTENPVFDRSGTVSETSFYLGDTAYFHFELYDENKASVDFKNPYYSSLDTSILTITSDGKLTGKKAGTATLSVSCTVNNKQVYYKVIVTVLPRRSPAQLVLSKSNVTLSNVSEEDYGASMQVTAYDQYHNAVNLASAIAELKEKDGKAILARYDSSTGEIKLQAQGAQPGTYTYTLKLLVGGSQLTASFQVTVQAVPANGIETYLPETNTIALDTSTLTAGSEPLCFKLRLARYVNGIFAGYATLQSASVQSDAGWHSDDLTAKASSKARKIYPEDNQIILTAGYWDSSTAAAKTAAAGTYTVTLQYYEIGDNKSSELQRTQLVVVVK
ncbi:MAG: hypothetical protein ACOCM4_06125 [Acetivibrio ethanolgignens]